MLNQCPFCDEKNCIIDITGRGYSENMYDRRGNSFSYETLYCTKCKSEIESEDYFLCEECGENVAQCDDCCVDCTVKFYVENPNEFKPDDSLWEATSGWSYAKSLILEAQNKVDSKSGSC